MRRINYTLEEIFEVDGSLRDIIIKDTQLEDWNKLIHHLKNYEIDFTLFKDGESTDITNIEASEIFRDKENCCMVLEIIVGGVSINCHFFWVEEIEMDINPAEVQNYETAEKIFTFLENLSFTIGKNIILTPEGTEIDVLAQFSQDV